MGRLADDSPATTARPEAEIGAYLSSLASNAKVSASTQNQALAALMFLYQHVLGRELQWLGNLVHAKRPAPVPVVLGREEVRSLLACLDDPIRWTARRRRDACCH